MSEIRFDQLNYFLGIFKILLFRIIFYAHLLLIPSCFPGLQNPIEDQLLTLLIRISNQSENVNTALSLSYSDSPYVFTNSLPISPVSPTFTGSITSCTSLPALPTGLILDQSNCTLSGTPTMDSAASNYTITASNSLGSATAVISIEINTDPPTGLSYTGSSITLTENVLIVTAFSPTVTGTVVSYSIAPALPAGLNFNTTNGEISGTPTVTSVATNYTIVATNPSGSTNFILTLTIVEEAPAGLSYFGSPYWFRNGQAIPNYTPSLSTGTATSFAIAPALPTGLSFNTTTGVISGTPIITSANATYTVTATNSVGNTTTTFDLLVNNLPPGTMDTTFNVGSGVTNRVDSIDIQSDGKIILGGNILDYDGTARNYLVRINSDGSIDGGFAPNLNNAVRDIHVQSDGNILIAGDFTTVGATPRSRIARLLGDGNLDVTFNPGTGSNGNIYSIGYLPSNNILLNGTSITQYNGTLTTTVFEILNDGSMNTPFPIGTGPGGLTFIRSSYVYEDGRVLLVGAFIDFAGDTKYRKIVRLNADLTVDPTFDPGTGAQFNLNQAAVQSDGKIVIVGGASTYDGNVVSNIFRINADGSFDPTFTANSGTGVTGAGEIINTVSIQSDDKILIGGRFTNYDGTARQKIARLNAEGTLDTSFVIGIGFGAPIVDVNAIEIQPDGKILAGGSFINYDGNASRGIVRILP